MIEIEEVMDNIEDRDNTIYRLYFEANPIPEAQRKTKDLVGLIVTVNLRAIKILI